VSRGGDRAGPVPDATCAAEGGTPSGSRGWSNIPRYSAAERRADAAVHAGGLLAVIAGCVILGIGIRGEAMVAAATALYAAGLCATFFCSAAYNLAPDGPWKARLRRMDHAAIFLMIAGTYSPVSLLGVGGTEGALLLGFVWIGAVAGAAIKLLAADCFERASIAAYLVLGWVGALALPSMLRALPAGVLALLAAGGLLYSLGVVVHLSTRIRYHNAIWHAFVLAAATCHFGVVYWLSAG